MGIDYKTELNKEQYEAVTTMEGPMLVLAGAGTGKTRMLIYRVAYMMQHGILPEEILLLTFTNKAAREMKDRLEEMTEGLSERVTAMTFHSFCGLLLREYTLAAGLKKGYTIVNGSDEEDIIDLQKTNLGYAGWKGFPKIKKIASIISKSINTRKSIREVVETDYENCYGYIREIEKIKKASDEYKRMNNMVGYDDVLILIEKLLSENVDIRNRIGDVYRYVMIDEYQDTNWLQDSIIRMITERNNNLAVVGDDLQALYKFRGADVHNIISFPERMRNCKVVFLTKNYRSNQEILDASNEIVKYATEGYPKQLQGTHYSGGRPQLVITKNQLTEVRYIIENVKKAVLEGTSPREICILARNTTQMVNLEVELTKEGIAYDKYGGKKFLEKPHIKDMMAYLRVITNPRDELAWYRILQVHYGIGKKNARDISTEKEKDGFAFLLDDKYKKRQYAKELKLLYEELMEVLKYDDFHKVMKELSSFYHITVMRNISGMKTSEKQREEKIEEQKKRREDLVLLQEIAERYTDVIAFLDDMSLDNIAEGEKEDKIVLSTIHSAKGLEFNTVFMMDCIDELFPETPVYLRGSSHYNEELRCFYVAVTRAKEKLCMISPKSAKKYKRYITGRPAHFINMKTVNVVYG